MKHRFWASQVFNIGLVDVDRGLYSITWGVPFLFLFDLKWSKLRTALLMGPKNPFNKKKFKKIVFEPMDPLKM
jgi:hypothetical protein